MSGIYLELFNGRKSSDEVMDDWGLEGPVFGPFDYVHTTYSSELNMRYTGSKHHCVSLSVVQDMIYHDGIFYGDWSVFSSEYFMASIKLQTRLADLVKVS